MNHRTIGQPRTMIFGLGHFGLRAQVHLWKRLMYAIELRRRNFAHLAPPQDFINFLTLRVVIDSPEIALYRPNLKEWREITATESEYNFTKPSPADLENIFSKTMDRCPVGSISPRKSQLTRSDVFSSMIALRTPLLQQFREALFPVMSDRSITQAQVAQIHVIVLADITNELDSALLWPTLALLNEALSEYQNSDLSVFLKTAVYSPAPISTAARATAYLTLRELEFFSNWEMISLLPDFMRQLLPNRYWAKYLRRVLFDRCYLMDNIKFRDNRSTSLQDIIVALGNSIEAMVMADLQRVIRERLDPDISHIRSIKRSKLAPRGDKVASEEYEKSNILIEGWEYPYEDAKMLYRRGIFSGIGAATIYMPVDKLDAWGYNKVHQHFFEQFLRITESKNSDSGEQAEEFLKNQRLTIGDIAHWLTQFLGGAFPLMIKKEDDGSLKATWRRDDILRIDDLYPISAAKDWLQRVDMLWKPEEQTGKLQEQLDRIHQKLNDSDLFLRKQHVIIDNYREDVFALMRDHNEGAALALEKTRSLIDAIDEMIDQLQRQLASLHQDEQSYRQGAKHYDRQDARRKFEEEWDKHPLSRKSVAMLLRWDNKIKFLFQHSSAADTSILAKFSRYFTGSLEKAWRSYYLLTLEAASRTLTKIILQSLLNELFSPLREFLQKMEQALQAAMDKLENGQQKVQQKITLFDQEYAHFLRTSQRINDDMKTKLYESWSQAIFDSIQKTPLLSSHIQELGDSLEQFCTDFSEHLPEEAIKSYGEYWAQLIGEELRNRIQKHAGRWFDGEFLLESELLKRQSKDELKKEIALLRRRAQPFIRIESDMFDHEVLSLEFVTLFSRTNSTYVAKEVEKYQSIVLDTLDPYTITYLQTYHGLNVWVLPFVEFYRKEFQILNDEDRNRLMLHPAMDNTQYGFAKKVPEIQLQDSVFEKSSSWTFPSDIVEEQENG